MKFTKKQQNFIKQCGEHFEVLTGGRGHSKTKEVIEDMQKEIERLNNIINRTTKYVQSLSSKGRDCDIYEDIKQEILQELKGDSSNE